MSDVNEAIDAPYVMAVAGFGDVRFAYADLDYWAERSATIRQARIAKDKLALAAVRRSLDPVRAVMEDRRIDEQQVSIDEVIGTVSTVDGLKLLVVDSIVRGGRPAAEAAKVVNAIGIQRTRQLAVEVTSEPVPSLDKFRESIRAAARDRGMHPNEAAQMTDADLIRYARDMPAKPEEPQDGTGDGPLADGPAPADTTA